MGFFSLNVMVIMRTTHTFWSRAALHKESARCPSCKRAACLTGQTNLARYICCAADPVIEDECADNSAISFQYEAAELLFTVADTLAVLRNVDEQMCADACLDREGCVVYEWRDAYVFPATDSSSNDEDIPILSVCVAALLL